MTMLRIKCIAIKRKDGTIIMGERGARHCQLILHDPKLGEGKLGFVTECGLFVGREAAARIAFKAGQIKQPKQYLFSEDLNA